MTPVAVQESKASLHIRANARVAHALARLCSTELDDDAANPNVVQDCKPCACVSSRSTALASESEHQFILTCVTTGLQSGQRPRDSAQLTDNMQLSLVPGRSECSTREILDAAWMITGACVSRLRQSVAVVKGLRTLASHQPEAGHQRCRLKQLGSGCVREATLR